MSLFQAFNDSSNFKFNQSVLERNHNLEVKNKYDCLLKELIPRFSQKGKTVWNFLKLCLNRVCEFIAYKQFNHASLKCRDEPIQIVDLSSDETETYPGAVARGEPSQTNRFPPQYRKSSFEFKKPSAFIDLSDDEDSDAFAKNAPLSSTINLDKKSESLTRSRASIVPDVKPVNSLAEKQQSRNCLKDDAIASIVLRFEDSQRKNDSQINEVAQT